MTIEALKACSMCNQTMCVSNFYKARLNYYHSRCKKCYRGYNKYVKKNPKTRTDLTKPQQIEYIKENYNKMSTSQISINLGYSECYLRKFLRELGIIPEDRIRKRGRPRKAVL